MIITSSCGTERQPQGNIDQTEQTIRLLTYQLDEAESKPTLSKFVARYTDFAILMPEYQVTLTGRTEIENYYQEISKRQRIKAINRQPHEFIHLANTIIVIGTFKREYDTHLNDSSITLNGKYWQVWTKESDTYRIKGEAFGYFHPVDHPESLIISTNQKQPDESDIQIEVPFELKAYNALMEKGVRQRDAPLRIAFFMEDGIFYPFADSAVVGMSQLKPYLTAYSRAGTVTIESVSCYTFRFENFGDHILEYAMFKVDWSHANGPGKTEGKGIRIWKRQSDGSLKLFREIGTHNYL
jgi:ketosteroid isomerase-like protein